MQGDYENEKDSLSEEMNTRTREHEIGARIQGFVLAIYREYQLHGVINYGVLRDYSVICIWVQRVRSPIGESVPVFILPLLFLCIRRPEVYIYILPTCGHYTQPSPPMCNS